MRRFFSAEQLDKWIDRLNAADLISFDTETTSLNYMEARDRRSVLCR